MNSQRHWSKWESELRQICESNILLVGNLMSGSKRSVNQQQKLTYLLILILQGVPLRLEIGPLDIKKSQTLSVRRDTGIKKPLPLSTIAEAIPQFLETIQQDIFDRAKKTYDERIIPVMKWEDVVPALDNKCVVVMPWCEREDCEDEIKEKSARG